MGRGTVYSTEKAAEFFQAWERHGRKPLPSRDNREKGGKKDDSFDMKSVWRCWTSDLMTVNLLHSSFFRNSLVNRYQYD